MNDLTIIFYTANHVPRKFMEHVIAQLKKSDYPIISVSHQPMDLGHNICVGDIGRSAYNIYKQILIGAKEAKTEYIATAEDDVLYPPEHFEYRPKPDTFAYDEAKWGLYTWSRPPIFSWKERRTMTSCISNRQLMIDTLETRFNKYPDPLNYPEHSFGEPGKYENNLKLPPVKSERFFAKVPHVMFSTDKALGYENLGTRKAHGPLRAVEIPYWNRAEDLLKLYED